MAIFNAKVEYALRAVLDLALQPSGEAVQSREIAHRQGIPEAYLDQVLSLLRRHGIVESIRGAGGGYRLGRRPHEITVAHVVRACNGPEIVTGARRAESDSGGSAGVILELCGRVERAVQQMLEETTVRDLVERRRALDETQSLMAGI
jgi:Rrf2 family protein